ncbi:hypothetical protein [Scytonema millei]|uniref:Uncharacterized protein n=1 Tax=Scytonema millei VB511283 TaxID=1245923 RepID=A0A9X5EB05_9CYAN|nr:hypothetical protein [Scytonema millei]NHC37234.1 hypothetical protein [Scytonema millei VB511283]
MGSIVQLSVISYQLSVISDHAPRTTHYTLHPQHGSRTTQLPMTNDQ